MEGLEEMEGNGIMEGEDSQVTQEQDEVNVTIEIEQDNQAPPENQQYPQPPPVDQQPQYPQQQPMHNRPQQVNVNRPLYQVNQPQYQAQSQPVPNQQYYQQQPVNRQYNQQPQQQQPVNQQYYTQPPQQPVNNHPYNRLPQEQPVNQPYNQLPPQQQPPANQPHPPQYPGQAAAVTWSTDLFAFDDINLCLFTNFLPCITFGWIAEIVDKGTTPYATSAKKYATAMLLPGSQVIYSGSYRTKMRQQYGIPGDGMDDVWTHLCCEGCALYQEYKELTARGYDVPLGWQGNINMAKQREAQGEQMPPAPVAPNGMTR